MFAFLHIVFTEKDIRDLLANAMDRGASMTSQDIKLKHEQNMITVRTIALILCHIDSCMNEYGNLSLSPLQIGGTLNALVTVVNYIYQYHYKYYYH